MAAIVLEQTHQSSPMATQNTSPAELRHITSNTNLASPTRERRLSNRTSQHLRTHRLGSRSPSSIPSSPTSVHSSSSAIFERDIEPINPSPPHLTDPHRMPRGLHTEQLDQAVPSVLDSAAEILTASTSTEDVLDSISIVAPIPIESSQSGFTSPISRFSSRSPSPTGNRRSVLLNIPSPSPSFTLPLPLQQLPQPQSTAVNGSPPNRPTVQTNVLPNTPPPVVSTPTSAYFSVHSEDSSPTTATHHEHPLHNLLTPTSTGVSPTTSPAMSPSNGSTLTAITTATSATNTTSHPPSPKSVPSKRLSFISYTDLLSSTPANTLTLSSLTSSAQVNEPPPHLPSVVGFPQAQAQMLASGSSAGSVHGSLMLHADRDSATGMVDDVGGEWEREGLGRGLEERLESLMHGAPAGKA